MKAVAQTGARLQHTYIKFGDEMRRATSGPTRTLMTKMMMMVMGYVIQITELPSTPALIYCPSAEWSIEFDALGARALCIHVFMDRRCLNRPAFVKSN